MPKSTWSFVGMQNTSLATSRRLISFGLSDARTERALRRDELDERRNHPSREEAP